MPDLPVDFKHDIDYSFVIRRATLDDAEDILQIMHLAFSKYVIDSDLDVKQSDSLEALSEAIDDIKNDINDIYVYIAFVDGIPVGSVRFGLLEDGSAYLKRFGVRSDYNNMGIGLSLMALVDKIMVTNNVKRLSLYTASKNKNLVRFYYGRGFYIESTTADRGYIRALMVKEY